MRINLIGAFLISKYACEKMIQNFDKNKDCNGVIIHMSSIMGLQGMKGALSYAASKAAMIGMTLPMARDLGKYKIRVNCVCPGLILTPMAQELSVYLNSIKNNTPIKRLGLPREITQACEAIIVNDFINGTLIKVDGGIIGHF
jgi:NAD(P)-dependent dehydrogenase (short-subunit alcohol dehydrogenase family)